MDAEHLIVTGETYLYRFYDARGMLLYIGITGDFGKRWQQHAQKQPWWNDRRRMTVDLYDTRDDAIDAEALAIFAEQPKHNVLHRRQALRLKKIKAVTKTQPVSRRVRTRPASSKKAAGPARWEDPRYLAYLGSEEYEQDVRRDFERAHEKEQSRLAGTWSDCERHEWKLAQAVNLAIEQGIDLDTPEFYQLTKALTNRVISLGASYPR